MSKKAKVLLITFVAVFLAVDIIVLGTLYFTGAFRKSWKEDGHISAQNITMKLVRKSYRRVEANGKSSNSYNDNSSTDFAYINDNVFGIDDRTYVENKNKYTVTMTISNNDEERVAFKFRPKIVVSDEYKDTDFYNRITYSWNTSGTKRENDEWVSVKAGRSESQSFTVTVEFKSSELEDPPSGQYLAFDLMVEVEKA